MDEYFVEEKSAGDRLLDLLVFIAVFVVTIFLILEILGISGKTGIDITSLTSIYIWVSLGVFIIFVLDLVRLWKKSENAKDFFTHNWLDVLATIPFELLALWLGSLDPETVSKFAILKWFRFAKLSQAGKLQKVSRVSKISKEFKAAAHLKKEGEEYRKKHRL